ncbi:MAG: hypothetical protein KDD41_11965 [Flavobacteriales bacterium]|nr:hypothetical protein [Flavobacteriales bacterium]
MQTNRAVIAVFFLLISAAAFTQATTNSPYSKYGIGELRPETFSYNFGMGGTAIGIRSFKDIGYLNPASYSAIANTTFDVGYTNNALWLKDNSESQHQNNPYISHIAFAMPVVKNKWGMSFGMMPFSSVGYQYDEVRNDSIAGGDYSYYTYGEGALNKLYWGNALAFNIDSTSLVSFGFNGYYIFGAMTYDQKIIYGNLPNALNVWKLKDVSVADFGGSLGLQYQKKFIKRNEDKEKDEFSLTFGVTYDLAADLNTTSTTLLRTFKGNIDFGTLKDTTSFDENTNDVTRLPSKLGVGFSLEKENKWLIAADYRSANWGAIQSSDTLYSYQSSQSIAIGGQFIPSWDGRKYYQRMAYRFGIRYASSYLAVNNTDWSEYGITFGIGLPVRRSEFTYPRLNLGIEYGSRGTMDNGLVKENFLNFNVGVTINAIWFQKRKYD